MLQNKGLSSQPGLLEKILELKESHCSPYLLAFLFDCYEDLLESRAEKGNLNGDEQKKTLRKALEVSVQCTEESNNKELMKNLVRRFIIINSSLLNCRFVIFWQKRKTPFARSTGYIWDVL